MVNPYHRCQLAQISRSPGRNAVQSATNSPRVAICSGSSAPPMKIAPEQITESNPHLPGHPRQAILPPIQYGQSGAVHVEVPGNPVQVLFCMQLASVEYQH
jgi:hypothetical protein